MHLRSKTAEELQGYAAQFAGTLHEGAEAVVVTLSGELGAGKTAFAQGMARALGVGETVSSPTFVIEKVYELKGQHFERLIHIDAYRIKGVREMEVLGWHEMLKDPKNLVVIEWPEKIADLIPAESIALKFDIEGQERIITSTYGS